jgi:hypothetical protein
LTGGILAGGIAIRKGANAIASQASAFADKAKTIAREANALAHRAITIARQATTFALRAITFARQANTIARPAIPIARRPNPIAGHAKALAAAPVGEADAISVAHSVSCGWEWPTKGKSPAKAGGIIIRPFRGSDGFVALRTHGSRRGLLICHPLRGFVAVSQLADRMFAIPETKKEKSRGEGNSAASA